MRNVNIEVLNKSMKYAHKIRSLNFYIEIVLLLVSYKRADYNFPFMFY